MLELVKLDRCRSDVKGGRISHPSGARVKVALRQVKSCDLALFTLREALGDINFVPCLRGKVVLVSPGRGTAPTCH